ncbi:hypothetical protein HY642_06370 [Candidatus Woesearchaeota archaeon]|nr:hypothetical protein [Candidatus Woesearchaeota archaeon]
MSYDLSVGFRAKPADLEAVLEWLGFRMKWQTGPEHASAFWAFLEEIGGDPMSAFLSLGMRHFEFYDPQRSAAPVGCCYYDKLGDSQWRDLAESVVACATLTTNAGRNEFDLAKQLEVAKHLRDHYGALLYDQQQGRLVLD